MDFIRKSLFRLSPYFGALCLYWVLIAVLLIQYGYHGSFKFLNSAHLEVTDYSSLYFFTHLGDGIILPAILLLILWRFHPALAVLAVLAVLTSGIFAQLLKQGFFSDWNRPAKVFAGDPMIQIFQPDPPEHRSFPSGHSTTMAAGGIFFAYFFSYFRKWLAFGVGLFTAFLCYTRVILGVHFPGDTLAGGILGALTGLLALLIFLPRFDRWFLRQSEHRLKQFNRVFLILLPLIIIGQFVRLILSVS